MLNNRYSPRCFQDAPIVVGSSTRLTEPATNTDGYDENTAIGARQTNMISQVD